MAANDFHLCQIESLKAEKVEAAPAIIAACQASKDANTRRDAAIEEAEEKRLAFLAAVVGQKRLAIKANEAQLEYNARIREQPHMQQPVPSHADIAKFAADAGNKAVVELRGASPGTDTAQDEQERWLAATISGSIRNVMSSYEVQTTASEEDNAAAVAAAAEEERLFSDSDEEDEDELGRTQDYDRNAATGRIPSSASNARGGNRLAPAGTIDISADFLRAREATTIEEEARPRPEVAEDESAAKRCRTAAGY